MFDLFQLHQAIDVGPKSWICFKGPKLRELIQSAVRASEKQARQMACELAKQNNCSEGPFAEVFYSGKEWVPMPMLLYLIGEGLLTKEQVLERTDYLKVNAAKSKPVKAAKEITKELCLIAGAHAADGNIHFRIGFQAKNKRDIPNNRTYSYKGEHRYKDQYVRLKDKINEIDPKKVKVWQDYAIDIIDGYHSGIKAYKKWMKNVFGIDWLKETIFRNAWRINFSNKIIARYLITFLGFPAGKKTTIVAEPKLIREAGFVYRRAFLKGVLAFDGCASSKGFIILVSKSKPLIDSAESILRMDGYSPHLYHYKKMDRWHLTLNKLESLKAVDYMSIAPEKEEKIWCANGLRKDRVSQWA